MRPFFVALACLTAPLSAQSAPASDPFLGSFTSEAGSITIAKEGANYNGTIQVGGTAYPFAGRKLGKILLGSFQAQGASQIFQASVDGDRMTFVAGGETTLLTRGQVPATVSAQGARSAQGAQRSGGAQGAPGTVSGQDAQLQQLLLSSPWCYLRYSQTLGSTSTERARFYPDGRLVVQRNYEMVSSGQNGTAYGNSSGGDVYRWRVTNGDLQIADANGAFQPTGLHVTRNSNGYPILNSAGKEYSQCN